jgi:hypothetical protein
MNLPDRVPSEIEGDDRITTRIASQRARRPGDAMQHDHDLVDRTHRPVDR